MITLKLSVRARELHMESLVLDAHVDTLIALVYGRRSLGERSEEGHVDLPRLREGGVNVQFFAHYIEPQFKPDRALLRFMQMADTFFREVEANSDLAEVAFSAGDIHRITSAGRIACVLTIEGGEVLQGDLGVLRVLHRLGLRALGMVWNQRNFLADGVGEARTGGGLTNLGVEAVREMDRLGIVIDVSHLSDPGFWDVVEYAEGPFIASHSNARAVCPHPRNLTDEQIKALAAKGGVMGMNFAPDFVHPEEATLEGVLDHVDHIAGLVGIGHIGLGSDFDGIGSTPRGLEDVTRLPQLTQGLMDRGYSDEQIRAILGGNFLRVLERVWGD
ncbi:MAG: dipeptidase [Bacillota bacterium]